MITSDNINEALSVIKLFNLPDISDLIPYLLAIFLVSTVIYIVNKISAARKAPKEYLENAVTVFLPRQDSQLPWGELVKIIYEKTFEIYKNRSYISCEVILTKDSSEFFMRLPKIAAKSIEEELSKLNIKYELINDPLDKFISRYKNQSTTFIGELEKDIIFPLNINHEKGSIKQIIPQGGCLYIQLLLRPVYQNWIKMIKDYEHNMRMGKDPTSRSYGCIGEFASISIPFLNFLLNFFSFIFSGSLSSKSVSKKEINDAKIKIVESKLSDYGFEFSMRGTMYVNEEHKEHFYSQLLDFFEADQQENYNNIVIDIDPHNISNSEEADLLLRYMDKEVVDILNDLEVARLIESLYN